jgi:DNA-binding response OmpR family regulator
MSDKQKGPTQTLGSILVVDDDTQNLQFLQEYLQGEGYRVYLARSGDEALNVLREFRPNLMIVDLVMPDMDGFDMTKAAKILYPAMPVIAMSEQQTESGRMLSEIALKLGADVAIGKPVSRIGLLLEIGRLLYA